MAEAAAARKTEEEAAGAAPARPRRDWTALLVALLTTINLGALGGLSVLLRNLWEKVNVVGTQLARVEARQAAEVDAGAPKPLQPREYGVLYPLEGFLVNLPSDHGPKFLQTQIELELADPIVESELAKKNAAVRDSVIVLLSSRPYQTLREAAGLKQLREDVKKSINQLLTTGKVREVYFTQFHFN